jgi:hypothetical protein
VDYARMRGELGFLSIPFGEPRRSRSARQRPFSGRRLLA